MIPFLTSPNKNTAVLIFIRSEKEEAQLKKFGHCLSFDSNYQIATLLNKRIKTIARQSGLPTVVVSGDRQAGETFGQKFTEAIQQVFDKGYGNIIAIGNDCLTITPAVLRNAAAKLRDEKTVLGPTQDGGVYLLGFQKSAFEPKDLAALPWQTGQLMDALKNYFEKLQIADLCLYKTAVDADDPTSFQIALNHFSHHFSFKNILRNILQNLAIKRFFFRYFMPVYLFNQAIPRRGPPSLPASL